MCSKMNAVGELDRFNAFQLGMHITETNIATLSEKVSMVLFTVRSSDGCRSWMSLYSV